MPGGRASGRCGALRPVTGGKGIMKAWASLRVRLVVSYLALSLILLTIAGLVFSAVLSVYARHVHREQAMGYFAQTQAILAEARANRLSAAEAVNLLRQQLPDLEVEVLSPREAQMRTGPALFLRPAEPVTLFRPGIWSGSTPTIWMTPYGVERGAPAVIRLTLPARPGAVARSLMGQVLLVLAFSLGLAGLIGWWLSRWLSRPLARLTDAVTAVAAGDFLQTVDETGVTELDRLAGQFNRMVLSLRESFRSLTAERDIAQRFAANAAHELKTPVATLRAYHELVTEKPDRLPQVLPPLYRQVERMERVIDGLLEMARLSEGTGITLVPGDLAALVRHLAPSMQAMVQGHGHSFAVKGEEQELPVRLDPRLTELAIANLIDNAAKYTPAGGEVGLHLAQEEGWATLTVSDTGPGIGREELPYIFERFHRGIGTQAVDGTGLGLSIAKEAVSRMGGTITVSSEPGHGSRFTIRLPLDETR
jgi:signal transduction histidine kinase